MQNTSKRQQVIDFARQQALVRPRDLSAKGLPKDYLFQLAREGVLENIGRGLYQWPKREVSRHQSLLEVAKMVPKGVVSLLSALSFHELTTQNPFEVWLAIDRKARRPSIDYPPIRFVTMSQSGMAEGVKLHTIEGVDVKVFCVAKTVADCFKYRHKIGLDVALEALKEGWKAQKFTMDELAYYAKVCRVGKVMQPYMEAL
ncbi:MAG: type IV toxin-antitoxin system AbiEi family antitoxin domain-containing protein [Gammaproteobacteria bacterium]|nr:type IV toxin-antitoxin system AbiEi family antitoxin domain-containing protein [Gammaproteobacteria bacterium]